jgi:quercetin dioxygenase-like cupin family protein
MIVFLFEIANSQFNILYFDIKISCSILNIQMAILKSTAPLANVRPGVTRRLIHGRGLMMVVIDFTNGPWTEPEPPHHHIHEQTTYVVEGEIIFFCEGEQQQQLKDGDMFFVPSDKNHTIQLLSKTVKLVDSFSPIRRDFLSLS